MSPWHELILKLAQHYQVKPVPWVQIAVKRFEACPTHDTSMRETADQKQRRL